MTRIPITVPEFIMPKKDLENPCPCQDRPIETTFKEGLVFWQKEVGDAVKEGETICELEIEKKTAELAAPVTGILAEQTLEEGAAFNAESILGYMEG